MSHVNDLRNQLYTYVNQIEDVKILEGLIAMVKVHQPLRKAEATTPKEAVAVISAPPIPRRIVRIPASNGSNKREVKRESRESKVIKKRPSITRVVSSNRERHQGRLSILEQLDSH